MIFSRGRRFIFIHIPKTGGTSLALAYEARAMKDDILVGDTPKAARRRKRQKGVFPQGALRKHMTLADLCGLLGPEDLSGVMVCTLVRNPWARCLSYYRWLRLQSFDHPAVATAKRESFDGFLNDPEIAASLRHGTAESYVTAAGAPAPHFIRLEHPDADLPAVEAYLGFPLRPLPHVNASAREGLAAAYTPALAARVADLCAADIARFGYRFPDP
ncbi:Type II secretory pathway, pullulanase PulA [Ovoidimarina sediminis]|uniref:Type II secretory pathway, pullulanase PulA n=1 Tax=Ovoidimarina sediminis TaxID=3079856 RepID=UPI00290EFF3D|nr:Type II secretory pathway, pullulanase PulA [Rhodophyticola sp. MJ-SS7]MDU8943326.1 Type II secretory pathway, pullulanase PulA [Rhodophyticola sp. MJ-SS7]